MKMNLVTKSEVPPPPYASALVCIPIAAVPFTLGALVLKSQKYWYASPDDWHAGRRLLASFGKALLMDCAQPIVDAIDRVYNLLDSGLNGTERTATGTGTEADPYIYTPPLPQVMAPETFVAPGVRVDMMIVRAVLDNLINGNLSTASPVEAIPNYKLQVIIGLIEAMGGEDGPTAAQVAQIITILGA